MTNKIYNWIVRYIPTMWLAAMASLPLVGNAANEPPPYGALYCESDNIPGDLPIVTNTVQMVSNAVSTAVSDHVSLSTNNVLTVGNRSVAIPPRTKTIDGREYSVVYGNELAGYATSEELNTLSTNLVEDIEDIAAGLTSATNDLSTTFGRLVETTSNSVMTAISDSTNKVMQTVGTATNDLKRAIGDMGKTILNDIAPEFNTNAVYAAGDIVFYDGKVYYCISGAEAGEWDSADFRETSIVEVLGGALLRDGVVWWEDVVEPNNYAKSSDPIIFTPSEVGFSEGDKIKAVTIIASSSYYFTPSSYALRLMDDQGMMLGNTDIVYVRNPGEEYTFTFPTPISLNPTNSYQLGFYDSPTSSNPVEVQLWIHAYSTNDNPNESLDLYWHHTYWRPTLKVARVSPSQVGSYKEEIGTINDKLNELDGAEPNVIEVVQVNGSALSVSNKTVNVIVPEKATSAPVIAGIASIGDSDKYAAANHVHPAETEVVEYALPDECFPVTYTYNGAEHAVTSNGGLRLQEGDNDEIWLYDSAQESISNPICTFSKSSLAYRTLGIATSISFGGISPTPSTWPVLEKDAVFVREKQVVTSVNSKTGAVVLTSNDINYEGTDLTETLTEKIDAINTSLAGKLGNTGNQTLDGNLTADNINAERVELYDGGLDAIGLAGNGLRNPNNDNIVISWPSLGSSDTLALVSQIYAAVQQIAPEWVSGTTYAADAKVSYNGVVYARKTSGSITSSTDPATDTVNWEAKKVSELFLPLTGGTMTQGSEIRFGTNYALSSDVGGIISRYNDQGVHIGYISLPSATTGDIALLEDIYAAVQQIAPAFTAKTYALDELCSYNGVVYRCKSDYTATAQSTKPSSDATHWESKKVSELFLPLTGGALTDNLSIEAGSNSTITIGTDTTPGKVAINAYGIISFYSGATLIKSIAIQDIAPLASPAFTGTPTAPTPTAGDDSTKVATTAFVQGAVGGKANSNAIANEFSSSSTYAVGDVVMYEGHRYKCVIAVSTAGEWDVMNWTQESVQAALGNITPGPDNTKLDSTSAAPVFSTASTYVVGDHCTYNGKLYRCTNAVPVAGNWGGATNWAATTIAKELLPRRANGAVVLGSQLTDGDSYEIAALDPLSGRYMEVPCNYGKDSISIGTASIAAGTNSIAIGNAGISHNAIAAVGNYSIALGQESSAIGDYSIAMGVESTAIGTASYAEGYETSALGAYSHAEGYGSGANGMYSHSEGGSVTAYGDGSHAEGLGTYAFGDYSHSEGASAVASNNYAHAEGYATLVTGTSAHAEGYRSIAVGNYSHSEGSGAVTAESGSGAQTTNPHAYAYAWQGRHYADNSPDFFYHSHGVGTYNINPEPVSPSSDVASGFFIGERSLADRLDDKLNKAGGDIIGDVAVSSNVTFTIDGNFQVLSNGVIQVESWDQITKASGQTLTQYITELITNSANNSAQ